MALRPCIALVRAVKYGAVITHRNMELWLVKEDRLRS
jgi:hypothetical protein